jgi:RecB family exonuclease
VSIPGCGFAIEGYIDRIDIAGDGKHARVRDYKTGRVPKDEITLDGGRELQRALYAFAVKALLGSHVHIDASLLYVREGKDLRLVDPDGTLAEVTTYLREARESLLAGNALPGVDAEDPAHPLAFALPANSKPTYYVRKHLAVLERLGNAAHIWDVK